VDLFHHQGIQQVDLPLADGTSPPHKVVESQLAEVGLLLEDEDSSETMQLCSGGAMQIRAGEIPVPVVHAGNRSASRYSGVSYFWLGTLQGQERFKLQHRSNSCAH